MTVADPEIKPETNPRRTPSASSPSVASPTLGADSNDLREAQQRQRPNLDRPTAEMNQQEKAIVFFQGFKDGLIESGRDVPEDFMRLVNLAIEKPALGVALLGGAFGIVGFGIPVVAPIIIGVLQGANLLVAFKEFGESFKGLMSANTSGDLHQAGENAAEGFFTILFPKLTGGVIGKFLPKLATVAESAATAVNMGDEETQETIEDAGNLIRNGLNSAPGFKTNDPEHKIKMVDIDGAGAESAQNVTTEDLDVKFIGENGKEIIVGDKPKTEGTTSPESPSEASTTTNTPSATTLTVAPSTDTDEAEEQSESEPPKPSPRTSSTATTEPPS
jgi:hypothetical protein